MGQVVRQYGYQPFGHENYKDIATIGSVYLPCARSQRGCAPLYYYNARYYDAEIGRFIQADSVLQSTASQGLNRYSYCANNPIRFNDPTGHFLGNIFPFLTNPVVSFLAGGILGGIQAELHGGNFWDGAWKGALCGLIGFGFGSLGGAFGGSVGAVLGAACGGALSGYITGGDMLMSAATAGITTGIGIRLGLGHPGFLSDLWFSQLILSTGVSALVGGVTTQIQGGNFWRGASDAAIWGAAGYVLSSVLNKDADPNTPPKDPNSTVDKAKVEIIIQRDDRGGDNATMGTYEVIKEGSVVASGDTLEPAPGHYAIGNGPAKDYPLKAGTYEASRGTFDATRKPYPDVELRTPGTGFNNIEIHRGNFVGDTSGCILVGSAVPNVRQVATQVTPPYDKVHMLLNASRTHLAGIMKYIHKNDNVTVTIRNHQK